MARRKKRFGKRVLIASFLLAAAAIVCFYFLQPAVEAPKFIRYKEFGIDMPVNYQIHGIDVSRYQKDIDWKEVKAMQVKKIRIGFTFIKATEGTDLTDERFRDNMRKSFLAGVPRGAYHFFNAATSGKLQAAHYLETVGLQKGDLPPVLDVETVNGAASADLRSRMKDWLQAVEKKYKVKPVIYTNIDFYKTFLAGYFDEYPLWVAHYLQKDKPRIERTWLFWQHNDGGRVNGIKTFVDFNAFNGDSAAFKNLLIKE